MKVEGWFGTLEGSLLDGSCRVLRFADAMLVYHRTFPTSRYRHLSTFLLQPHFSPLHYLYSHIGILLSCRCLSRQFAPTRSRIIFNPISASFSARLSSPEGRPTQSRATQPYTMLVTKAALSWAIHQLWLAIAQDQTRPFFQAPS